MNGGEKIAEKQVKLRDVARTAGVSTATVSRVMNGSPRVDPETRKRVMTVITRENYTINANASALGRLNAKKRRGGRLYKTSPGLR